MSCPACNCPDAKFLGTLGNRVHLRCTDCGIDYSYDEEDEDEDDDEDDDGEPVGPYDMSDDAFVLASAGMGTDEDYGYYGDMDF